METVDIIRGRIECVFGPEIKEIQDLIRLARDSNNLATGREVRRQAVAMAVKKEEALQNKMRDFTHVLTQDSIARLAQIRAIVDSKPVTS